MSNYYLTDFNKNVILCLSSKIILEQTMNAKQQARLKNIKTRFQEGAMSEKSAVELVSELMGISKAQAEKKVQGWSGKLSSTFAKSLNRKF